MHCTKYLKLWQTYVKIQPAAVNIYEPPLQNRLIGYRLITGSKHADK